MCLKQQNGGLEGVPCVRNQICEIFVSPKNWIQILKFVSDFCARKIGYKFIL